MIGKGAILLVLGFSVTLGIIGLRLNSLENRAIENVWYYYDVTQSHNLAVMGANVALSKLYQDTTYRITDTSQIFTTGIFQGGRFNYSVLNIAGNKVRVRSVSNYKGFRDTVEVILNRSTEQSFSLFAWITDFEGNIFWVTGDTVWGRVHSNGTLHISGSPVFMEKATTSKNFNPKPGSGTNKAIFKKGYETGIANIVWPTDMGPLISASANGGRKYATNIWVTLSPGTSAKGDGKAYIRTLESGPIVDSISLSSVGFNGALYSTQNVYVKGTLDGRLSIGAGSNIYVVDKVLYETNPLVSPNSTDILGLVANANVIIPNTSNSTPNTTLNLEIHACIFACTGSFNAEGHNVRDISKSGTLSILGGISQKTRGAVGLSSSNELIKGFSKRYRFDERLALPNFRPPYYPGFYTNTYSIASWWENVRIPRF